ncbi:MAG: ATP-binding protein, partial [Planctomycetota bacterium]
VYASLDHFVQRQVLLPSFAEVQRDEALGQSDSAARAIDGEIKSLERRTRALAELETFATFVESDGEGFAGELLEDRFLELQGLDLAYLVNERGEVLWSALSERVGGERDSLRGFPRGRLSPTHPLTTRVGENPVGNSGLFPSEVGPMVVAASPTGKPGRRSGWLLLGELISERRLEEEAGSGATAWTIEDLDMPPDVRAALDLATASVGPVVVPDDAGNTITYRVLEDLQSRPTVLLATRTPGAILESAHATIRYALLSAVAVGLTMLLVLQRLLARVVTDPLAQFTDAVVEIGARDDDTARLDIKRDDEIGVLAEEFESMLSKLSASRAALVSTARSAGMSEIATGILHNIGNVLNSVVLSQELATKSLQGTSLDKLERLSALLAEQDDLARFIQEDPRGTKLVTFLEALVTELRAERDDVRRELAESGSGIEHIRELVASQQALAGRSTVEERTQITDQIEKAVSVTASASGGSDCVEIVRDLEPLPSQLLDRHKLLEILVNLVQNARQAVSSEAADTPTITIRAAREGDRLRISVADNGKGIAPEDLERIFAHGFTTRREGNGFGLHASANSARQLGGNLTVHSEGRGHGAVFVLDLPLQS